MKSIGRLSLHVVIDYQDFNGGHVAFGGSKGHTSGKEFKNRDIIEFCGSKGIKREYIRTACYVLNMVLVTKPQNKTPYELLTGKFEEKSNVGVLVGYSLSSKAFRVYNLETKRVEENLHINFLENKPNVVGKGPTWLFDIDYLTDSMKYQPITAKNKANKTAVPLWSSYTLTVKSSKAKNGDEKFHEDNDSKTNKKPLDKEDQAFLEELERLKRQEKEANDAAETLKKTDIDYDEVFAPVARIEAVRIFLAFASYMGFIVYQMDVKSAFLNEKIDEEVYVSQPLGFIDPKFQNKMSSMGELTFFLRLQVKQKEDGIFISQDKYVAEILKKFDFLNVKTASTPIETKKPLVKDKEAPDVDVHLYRSMIGSLMYLTASRPDIMYAVYACSRFQVTPKTSHLQAVKRIFRESAFDLEAYSDSDYTGANLDRKSTTGGCQFLGRRLISWQCKKQTIIATSTTEAEYVAAASCCGQVLKIHTDDNVADLFTKAFDVSSKEMASPKQTALGKDILNPLIVDSLLKTIWLLVHHVIAMKHWLFQSKRLLVKRKEEDNTK
nr:uncharacterized mitochondrial protein AtMg00810-like [Tanacetum cinerariifolium]